MSDINKCGVYAPSYYNRFKCIADKCEHSCCVGWQICIDDETYTKYQSIENIFNTVISCEEGNCFRLTDNDRCPHLSDEGLCNIIISQGEEFLSEICKNHPRFFNFINSQRIEAGLGIVCEEACRLILENENPISISKVQDTDRESSDECETDFDPLFQRKRIFTIIEDPDASFNEKIYMLKTEFDIPDLYTPEEWLDRFLSLEILDPKWEELLCSMKGKLSLTGSEDHIGYGKYYERLLIYFVYRHVTASADMNDLGARLAFCVISVQLIRALFEEKVKQISKLVVPDGVPKELIDIARRYSAEIEYSEDNTDELIFLFENEIYRRKSENSEIFDPGQNV